LRGAGPGEPVIEWDGVWFARDGRPALRDVTLAVTAGITAVLGPNGAGKTTLLRHANGLLRPQRGVVRVLGRAIGRRPVSDVAREVGLVPQHPLQMLFAATVREELAAGPRALGQDDPAWRRELSERFGLTPLLGRVPQRLSAGEQRRVALAAILAARPRALLLDEPTAGQDAAGRRTLADLLTACAADGTAVVVATHDTAWAAPISQRRALLRAGRVEREAA
jgi:energy-coupling factor transport system ATP-binding protein